MGGIYMKINNKGFTLIELLIVVAIIAILAAIAIPQFSQYRIRGYNSAAASDLRNSKIALEAFKTDWQVYFNTAGCAAVQPFAGCTGKAGAGLVITGPGTVNMGFAINGITATTPPVATTAVFGLSNLVAAIINTDANAISYVIVSAHNSGDVMYGADSDTTSTKQAGKDNAGAVTTLTLKVPGGPLAAASAPAATSGADDITAAGWSTI
jgi:prepilin-type N-terminal cleavage/methylation domain-containing protein